MAYELLSLFVNVVLVCVTAIYALDNNRMIKLSSNAQEVLYIQTRLEKLYYPLKNCLYNCSVPENPRTAPSQDDVYYFRMTLYPIIFYLYLASDELSPLLNRFIGIFYKNGVMVAIKNVEELEEKRRDPNLREIKSANIDAWQALEKSKSISPDKLELPNLSEFQEAAKLYPKILDTIDKDISRYRDRLNKLTTNKSL